MHSLYSCDYLALTVVCSHERQGQNVWYCTFTFLFICQNFYLMKVTTGLPYLAVVLTTLHRVRLFRCLPVMDLVARQTRPIKFARDIVLLARLCESRWTRIPTLQTTLQATLQYLPMTSQNPLITLQQPQTVSKSSFLHGFSRWVECSVWVPFHRASSRFWSFESLVLSITSWMEW